MNTPETLSAHNSSIRLVPDKVFFNMDGLPASAAMNAPLQNLQGIFEYHSERPLGEYIAYITDQIPFSYNLTSQVIVEEKQENGEVICKDIWRWFSDRGVTSWSYLDRYYYHPDVPTYSITSYVPDLSTGLKQDALSFLKQKQLGYNHGRGNIGKWTFSCREFDGDRVCGDEIWEAFTVASDDYYVNRNGTALIEQNPQWIHSLVGDVDVIADFGCGAQEAVRRQILPLIAEFKKGRKNLTYAPIDNNPAYVSGAHEVVRAHEPDVSLSGIQADYLGGISLPQGSKLGLFFGASTNYASFPEGMANLLNSFRAALEPGSHIAMTLDTNTDRQSIKKSYSHELHGQQIINIIYRFVRDLRMTGNYDPDGWEYETQVLHFRHAGYGVAEVLHVMKSTKDQYMWLGGEGVLIRKGEGLVADKSFKMPVGLAEHIGAEMGYRLKGCKYDEQGWMALPVFQLL